MELVHDDVVNRGVRAVAEGDVGEDFGGAADDRGVVVDGGVAGDHADVFRAEDVAEGKEFLVG